MRTYLQNCMKLCFKKFDIFSGPNKALCWSWYFKRTSKWSSCRWGKAINSYLTLIEHHSSHADIQLHLIFQEIETDVPQENSSHKTLGLFVYRAFNITATESSLGASNLYKRYESVSCEGLTRDVGIKWDRAKLKHFQYTMITKRHKLKLMI